MTPKLDVNGVSFSYHTLEGETLALSDISFSLSPGEFAAVVGCVKLVQNRKPQQGCCLPGFYFTVHFL